MCLIFFFLSFHDDSVGSAPLASSDHTPLGDFQCFYKDASICRKGVLIKNNKRQGLCVNKALIDKVLINFSRRLKKV